MIALIQRVSSASVSVDKQQIARIDRGLLVLVGVEKVDTDEDARILAPRIANYRVFADDAGKMNLSVSDIGGAVLAVPQFTLAADTRRGRRPSFGPAAAPAEGKRLFDLCCGHLRNLDIMLETGEFGADMRVELVNDGPVTFWLSTH